MKLKNWPNKLIKILEKFGVTRNHWPKFLREYGIMQLYQEKRGYTFNLDNPNSFSEKIQWYKSRYHLYNHERYVDKYLFKDLVNEKLGPNHTIPCYGAWTNLKDFQKDWNQLPEKFCLKSNAQSDGKYIKVIEKNNIDLVVLIEELKDWIRPCNLLINSYCRAYYNVVPRLLAEEYVENVSNQLFDYKIFCFNGEPYCAYVAQEHFVDDSYPITFYDLEWNIMNVQYGKHRVGNVPKPKHFDEMIRLSKTLSEGIPFVRVDFFDCEERLYVAEMTFYPGGGYSEYHPKSFDYELGEKMNLDSMRHFV